MSKLYNRAPIVNVSDLNMIDRMNGQGNVNYNKIPVEGLKGALNKIPLSNGNSTQINIQNEYYFLLNIRNQILEFQMEQMEYQNLPKGLSKYRIENKLLQNGLVGLLKVVDTFYVVSIVKSEFNMYDEAVKVKINEPKSVLNGKEYKVGSKDSKLFVIRNNIAEWPILIKVWRFIRSMEKNLYQIEKNVLRSAPKGLLNLKNATIAEETTEQPVKESLERVVNSEDTIFVLRGLPVKHENFMNENDDPLWTPMEFTDKTNELITSYMFYKEEIKNLIGASLNSLTGKRERLITSEVEGQQDMSNYTFQHMINIRNKDLEEFNKFYNLNVRVDFVQSDKEKIREVSENNEKKSIQSS